MKSYGRIFNNISTVGSDYIAKPGDNIVIEFQCHGEPKLGNRFRNWLDTQPLRYNYHNYVFTILLSEGWSERMVLDKVTDIKTELGFK